MHSRNRCYLRVLRSHGTTLGSPRCRDQREDARRRFIEGQDVARKVLTERGIRLMKQGFPPFAFRKQLEAVENFRDRDRSSEQFLSKLARYPSFHGRRRQRFHGFRDAINDCTSARGAPGRIRLGWRKTQWELTGIRAWALSLKARRARGADECVRPSTFRAALPSVSDALTMRGGREVPMKAPSFSSRILFISQHLHSP
jgi:hypothetical protein